MADPKPSFQSVATENERRRTQRVQIAMPVIVRLKDGKTPFEEKTHTVSVNANGCLVRVQGTLIRGQKVSLINPQTTEELPCTVMFLGKKDAGKTEVGMEFTEASPLFWRISFPPEDWDPSERKRPGASRPVAPAAAATPPKPGKP